MELYIPHSIFYLARLLYVRPATFGPYYVLLYNTVPMKFGNGRSTGLDRRDYINHRETENIQQEINKYSKKDRESKEGTRTKKKR